MEVEMEEQEAAQVVEMEAETALVLAVSMVLEKVLAGLLVVVI
jgi:hypothetical protein